MWPVIMYNSAITHERRKLVENYKNVLPQKHIVVAEVCWEIYSKNDKKMEYINGYKGKKKNNPTN